MMNDDRIIVSISQFAVAANWCTVAQRQRATDCYNIQKGGIQSCDLACCVRCRASMHRSRIMYKLSFIYYAMNNSRAV